ncbi:MAG: hypothetical protein P1P90_05370 [Patescibacteria group bacterium]|nr:hypothetical protein [Patescibacteria group bacterium]
MKPFDQIRMDHPCYIVPAFLHNPVCETKAMLLLRKELRLRRKTIERVRMVQKPGSTFNFGGTKNRDLLCVLLAESPESLTYDSLRKHVSLAVRQTIEDTAVIGDGFRLVSKNNGKDDVHYGFELLCRVLRRLGFVGTLYEPPEYLLRPSARIDFPDEHITDTYTILRSDGSISPSLLPAMLNYRKTGQR